MLIKIRNIELKREMIKSTIKKIQIIINIKMQSEQQFKQISRRTRTLINEQQVLKSKASTLKQKLEQKKQKKQEQLEKDIKDHMVEHYQRGFQCFKAELEEETKSQSYSLELIKQFKLNQITELEEVVRNAIKYLDKSRTETEVMETKLKQAYQLAMQFVQTEADKQKQRISAELMDAKNSKIQEFKDSIYIQ